MGAERPVQGEPQPPRESMQESAGGGGGGKLCILDGTGGPDVCVDPTVFQGYPEVAGWTESRGEFLPGPGAWVSLGLLQECVGGR